MVLALRCSVQLNRDGHSKRQTGGHAEDQSQAETVPESKQNRISNGPGQQPQWAMRSTQQVVGKIEAAQHIQATACNGDGSNCVVIHLTSLEASIARGATSKNALRQDLVSGKPYH
ncbi:MAG: hypothetical protein ABSG13_04850 [Bryobacteraceae bacterium]|jgi:hypothetical protein